MISAPVALLGISLLVIVILVIRRLYGTDLITPSYRACTMEVQEKPKMWEVGLDTKVQDGRNWEHLQVRYIIYHSH